MKKCFFALLLLLTCRVIAQPIVVSLANKNNPILLFPYFKYAILDNPYPSADSILRENQLFVPFSRETISIGDHALESHVWIRFSIVNQSTEQEYRLILDNYFIDEITLFQFQDNKLIYQSPTIGDNFNFNLRPLATRNFVFPIHLVTNHQNEFLLRLNLHGRKLVLHPMLMATDVYHEWESTKRSHLFLFYGFLIALTLANFYLSLVFKDGLFGLLGFMLLSFLFEFIILGGWGSQYIWPNSPALGHKMPILVSYLALLTSFVFARVFLRENFTRIWFDRLLLFLILISSLFAVASMGKGYLEFIGIWYLHKLLFITFLVLFLIGVIAFRKQHPTARYVVLGMLCMAVVLFLSSYKNQPSEYFITRKSSLILFAAGLFSLSLSVLDRLTILKAEKEAAQELALQRLKSINEIKNQINQELEIKIGEASKLLQKKQKEISIAYLKGESKERKRVAEELHDSLGGLLATLKYTLQKIVQDRDSNGVVEPSFIHAMDLINTACQEVRMVSHSMMPVVLTEFGLEKALENLVEKLNYSSQVVIRTQISLPLNKFQPELELTIYRIVLELLNNVIKHAKATHVAISLVMKGETLIICVKDNGIGFETTKQINGMGYTNIKSRVKFLNGKYRINSGSAGGTEVIVEIPIASISNEEN